MYKLIASSDLMVNHKYAAVQPAPSVMQVAQTEDGHALLFYLKAGILYVSQESLGDKTGWVTRDLTTLFIMASGFSPNATYCKMFTLNQNTQAGGGIDILLVLTDGSKDFLYLSQNNSFPRGIIDQSAMQWGAFNTMDVFGNQRKIVYTNVALNYENQLIDANLGTFQLKSRKYIIDVLANPDNPQGGIARYFLENLNYYAFYNLDNTFNQNNMYSLVGQRANDPNYGVYTLKKVSDTEKKLYYTTFQPNANNTGLATPTIELSPGQIQAIATTLNQDATTRLYVVINNRSDTGILYSYESANQLPGFSGNVMTLMENTVLKDVVQLFAETNKTESILWGVNKKGEVFRTKCPRGRETMFGAWSVPVPIITNGVSIAPYLNHVTGKSIIFVKTQDGSLLKLKQDPATKIWQQRNILLNPNQNPGIQVQEIDTFTTHIQVVDQNDVPVPDNVTIKIETDSQASFYIHNVYTVMSTTSPNYIKTDDLGTMTIVQETHSLSAAKFKLTITDIDGSSSEFFVNPMYNVLDKLNSINTWDDLNKPFYDENNVAVKLIDGDISQPSKDNIINGIQNLKIALSRISNPSRPTRNPPPIWGLSFRGNDFQYSEGDATLNALYGTSTARRDINTANQDAIEVIAEDIFKWVKLAFEGVTDLAIAETKALIKIADKVYSIALDSVHAVAHTFQLILQKIKATWQKIKQYAGFVFNWKDIITTHNVLKKTFEIYSNHAITSVGNIETMVQNQIQAFQNDITRWGNSSLIPTVTDASGAFSKGKRPAGLDSPQAQYGMHHFKANNDYIGNTPDMPILPPDATLVQQIKAIVDADLVAFAAVKNRMMNEVITPFQTMTITQILKKITEILSVQTLEAVKLTLVGIINIVKNSLQNAFDSLQKEIEFPVLTWLYKKYSGNAFTIADAVCLVCAIPATIVYKLATNEVPFPKDAPSTNAILNATTFEAFQTAMNQSFSTSTRNTLPITNRDRFVAMGGVAAAIASGFLVYANSRTFGPAIKGFQAIDDIYAKRLSKFVAVANVLYVSPNLPGLLDSKWWQILNSGFTIATIAKGLASIKFTSGTARTGMDWLESVMNIAWFIPVVFNIIDEKDDPNYRGLIPESIADSGFNVAGILPPYIQLAINAGPESLPIAKGLYYTTNVMTGVYGVGIAISGFMKLSR